MERQNEESSPTRKRRSEDHQATSSPYKPVFENETATFSGTDRTVQKMSNSPKSEFVPKRYKKESSDDGIVSILDSPGPSSAFKRSPVEEGKHQDNAHFLCGAPREFIDAEDAYKIATQADFPNTHTGKLKTL